VMTPAIISTAALLAVYLITRCALAIVTLLTQRDLRRVELRGMSDERTKAVTARLEAVEAKADKTSEKLTSALNRGVFK
jgi:hypothetical protein